MVLLLQVNAVWESTVQPGWSKPDRTALRSDRERWIRAKYEHRGFVDNYAASDGSSKDTLGAMMCQVILVLVCARHQWCPSGMWIGMHGV